MGLDNIHESIKSFSDISKILDQDYTIKKGSMKAGEIQEDHIISKIGGAEKKFRISEITHVFNDHCDRTTPTASPTEGREIAKSHVFELHYLASALDKDTESATRATARDLLGVSSDASELVHMSSLQDSVSSISALLKGKDLDKVFMSGNEKQILKFLEFLEKLGIPPFKNFKDLMASFTKQELFAKERGTFIEPLTYTIRGDQLIPFLKYKLPGKTISPDAPNVFVKDSSDYVIASRLKQLIDESKDSDIFEVVGKGSALDNGVGFFKFT